MTKLEAIWDRIETQNTNKTESLFQTQLYAIFGGYACEIGSTVNTNSRVFILKNTLESEGFKFTEKRLNGVSIIPLEDNSPQMLVISLNEKDSMDIYTIFIEDLIVSLSKFKEPDLLLECFKQRLEYWGKFFSKVYQKKLSREEEQGLYSEIYILRRLLEKETDHCKVLKSWRGPLGELHDFKYKDRRIEVKSSKLNEKVITISNEDQLDYTKFEYLKLCVVYVHENSEGDNTLSRAIEEIDKFLGANWETKDLFYQKLNEIGVFDASIYDTKSFEVDKLQVYTINNKFPRITREMLNPLVKGVKYKVSLVSEDLHCEDFGVDFNFYM
ncbi:PD-(D/E)XK motif protein [Halosquirtibacter xylanolyticus]|uniref:PD-(D/E)XK motif protein n=1 Tax=Halosquirtibacter xylanolyticus TaxID=3374599 RepID=UPI00374789D9|nr:PD-(D/E)XK motif protein [Prolixibacteraceae bacterium]